MAHPHWPIHQRLATGEAETSPSTIALVPGVQPPGLARADARDCLDRRHRRFLRNGGPDRLRRSDRDGDPQPGGDQLYPALGPHPPGAGAGAGRCLAYRQLVLHPSAPGTGQPRPPSPRTGPSVSEAASPPRQPDPALWLFRPDVHDRLSQCPFSDPGRPGTRASQSWPFHPLRSASPPPPDRDPEPKRRPGGHREIDDGCGRWVRPRRTGKQSWWCRKPANNGHRTAPH